MSFRQTSLHQHHHQDQDRDENVFSVPFDDNAFDEQSSSLGDGGTKRQRGGNGPVRTTKRARRSGHFARQWADSFGRRVLAIVTNSNDEQRRAAVTATEAVSNAPLLVDVRANATAGDGSFVVRGATAHAEIECVARPSADGLWFDVVDNATGERWPECVMRLPDMLRIKHACRPSESDALFEPVLRCANDRWLAEQAARARAKIESVAANVRARRRHGATTADSGGGGGAVTDVFESDVALAIARPIEYDIQGLFEAAFALSLYAAHFFARVSGDGSLLFCAHKGAEPRVLDANSTKEALGACRLHTLRWRDVDAELVHAGLDYSANAIGSLRCHMRLDEFLREHAPALPTYAHVQQRPCRAPAALDRLHGRIAAAAHDERDNVDEFGRERVRGASTSAVLESKPVVDYACVAHLFSWRSPLWLAPALPLLVHDYCVLHAQRDAQWVRCKSIEAHTLQRPREKCTQTLFYCGANRIGKDFLAQSIVAILGDKLGCSTEQIEALLGRFNSYVSGKVQLVLDEQALSSLNAAQTNALKHLLSEPTIRIERKGVEAVDEPNAFRVRFHGNDLYDAALLRNFKGRLMMPDVCDSAVTCLSAPTKAVLFVRLAATRDNDCKRGLRTLAAFYYRLDLSNFLPHSDPLVTDTMRFLQQRQLPLVLQWLRASVQQCRLLGLDDDEPLTCAAGGRRWAVREEPTAVEHENNDCDGGGDDVALLISLDQLFGAFRRWFSVTRAAGGGDDDTARPERKVSAVFTKRASFKAALIGALSECGALEHGEGVRFRSNKNRRAWRLASPRALATVLTIDVPGVAIGEAVLCAHTAARNALEAAQCSGDASLVRAALLLLGREQPSIDESSASAARDGRVPIVVESLLAQVDTGSDTVEANARAQALAACRAALDAGNVAWREVADTAIGRSSASVPRSALRPIDAYEFCEREAARVVQRRDETLAPDEQLRRVLTDYALEHDAGDGVYDTVWNALSADEVGGAAPAPLPSSGGDPRAVVAFPTAEHTSARNEYTFERVIGDAEQLRAHVAASGRALAIVHYPGPDLFWMAPGEHAIDVRRDALTEKLLQTAAQHVRRNARNSDDAPDMVSLQRPVLALYDLFTAPHRCSVFYQRCDWLLLRADGRYSRLRRTRRAPRQRVP